MHTALGTWAPFSVLGAVVLLAFAGAKIESREAEAAHLPPRPSVPAKAAVAPRPPATDLANTAVAEPARASCGDGMLLVEGKYCPNVDQPCRRWLEADGRYAYFRCAEYGPSRCLSPARKSLRFCIDRDEHTKPNETLPENDASLVHADSVCRSEGKRFCRESEWNFACEGEEMRPYPYGFSRDSTACNADLTDLVDDEGKLRDHREASGSHPRCVSPFGVRDMAGNLEEMVARDGPGLTPAMKGAYWQPSRNHCRAAQTKHDAHYHGAETGFRCCADAPNAD